MQRHVLAASDCADRLLCVSECMTLNHICRYHTVHSFRLTFGGRVRQLRNSSLASLLSYSATHAVSFHASGEMPAAQCLQLKLCVSGGWHQKTNLLCLQMMRAAGFVWRFCARCVRAPRTTFLLPPCVQIPGPVVRSPSGN
jgi:hypothetical protein